MSSFHYSLFVLPLSAYVTPQHSFSTARIDFLKELHSCSTYTASLFSIYKLPFCLLISDNHLLLLLSRFAACMQPHDGQNPNLIKFMFLPDLFPTLALGLFLSRSCFHINRAPITTIFVRIQTYDKRLSLLYKIFFLELIIREIRAKNTNEIYLPGSCFQCSSKRVPRRADSPGPWDSERILSADFLLALKDNCVDQPEISLALKSRAFDREQSLRHVRSRPRPSTKFDGL